MTSDEVKRARVELGITQSQLAELLDVSVWTVRGWEQGKRNVPKWHEVRINAMMKETVD